MTPERKDEIRRFALDLRRVHGAGETIFDLLAALAEAEQERDELAERVIAFCDRLGGHVDESQQRHPTWRGVTS